MGKVLLLLVLACNICCGGAYLPDFPSGGSPYFPALEWEIFPVAFSHFLKVFKMKSGKIFEGEIEKWEFSHFKVGKSEHWTGWGGEVGSGECVDSTKKR